jgi:cytidylate kinase
MGKQTNFAMKVETLMEKSGAYVISERWDRHQIAVPVRSGALNPTITIAHQAGAGASEIAKRLAEVLQESEFQGSDSWEVFDQQLIERALQEQRWPKKLAEKITEEKRFFIDELMDDLFSLRPPSWVLVPQIAETTLRLAVSGHAILIGHGATVLTSRLPNVFHVRLTGSLSKRIERYQARYNVLPGEAAKMVRTEDRKRARFVKAHFRVRLDDELLYDFLIKTDRFPDREAATLIATAARNFFSHELLPQH